jgi:hypothetical protein
MTKTPTAPKGGRKQTKKVKPSGTAGAMASQTPARPKSESLGSDVDLLEAMLKRENLLRAWERVKANKGAAGIDGRSIAADARQILDELRDPARPGWTPPTSRAWIHLGLGETDQAFEEMERAIEQRDPIIMPILSFPHLDSVRPDTRFAILLEKMNLREPAR